MRVQLLEHLGNELEQPFGFDRARNSHPYLAPSSLPALLGIQRQEELRSADDARLRKGGGAAGKKHQLRSVGLAPFGDPVRKAGEKALEEGLVALGAGGKLLALQPP